MEVCSGVCVCVCVCVRAEGAGAGDVVPQTVTLSGPHASSRDETHLLSTLSPWSLCGFTVKPRR